MIFERLLRIARDLGYRKGERGAVQIELAFTIMTVMFVVFMTVELCSAVYTYVVLSDAANEGVRYAIVHSSDESGAVSQVRSYAKNSLHNVSGMTVSVAYPDGQSVPGRVRVTVSYPYVSYLNFMSSPPTMHAYAEGRLVY